MSTIRIGLNERSCLRNNTFIVYMKSTIQITESRLHRKKQDKMCLSVRYRYFQNLTPKYPGVRLHRKSFACPNLFLYHILTFAYQNIKDYLSYVKKCKRLYRVLWKIRSHGDHLVLDHRNRLYDRIGLGYCRGNETFDGSDHQIY